MKPEFEARGYQVFEISAATGEGRASSFFAMAALVAADRAARPAELPAERVGVKVAVKAADEPGFEVVRIGDSFLIRHKPQRWVRQTDFSTTRRSVTWPTGWPAWAWRRPSPRRAPTQARKS